mmetsp:Transcript_40485/g.96533  ORF Transcript_40485/g.96533 Transcript_40485/m.96533 type:complete len:228 (+) Transcript_40485:3832-4515(+)
MEDHTLQKEYDVKDVVQDLSHRSCHQVLWVTVHGEHQDVDQDHRHHPGVEHGVRCNGSCPSDCPVVAGLPQQLLHIRTVPPQEELDHKVLAGTSPTARHILHIFLGALGFFLISFLQLLLPHLQEDVPDDGKNHIHQKEGANNNQQKKVDEAHNSGLCILHHVHDVCPSFQRHTLEDYKEAGRDVVKMRDAPISRLSNNLRVPIVEVHSRQQRVRHLGPILGVAGQG